MNNDTVPAQRLPGFPGHKERQEGYERNKGNYRLSRQLTTVADLNNRVISPLVKSHFLRPGYLVPALRTSLCYVTHHDILPMNLQTIFFVSCRLNNYGIAIYYSNPRTRANKKSR